MKDIHCVVIGASHAGVSLAMQLRKEAWEGNISLIGAEKELPYHRPPLSKEHLAGEKLLDAMRLRPEKMFADNNIDLELGVTALQVHKAAQTVSLSNGQEVSYDKLAICTGSKVNTIPLGASLENVFYVRTAADVSQITPLLEPKKHAVIIGAGYIGLETAAVLNKLGLTVTVIELTDRILQRVTSEHMSAYIQALHEQAGVSILTGTAVESIEGKEKVEKVVCQDGTSLPADVVIIGVGVSPNTGIAEAAGLEVDRGIVVNEYAQTSDEHIYSAGDCTLHPSTVYERLIRLESVQNANDQARCAAANIAGKQQVYDAVPWFWSDQYHIKLQMVGLSQGAEEIVVRGEPSLDNESGFALFYLKDGIVIAADCVGRPKEFMAGKKLVKNRLAVSASMLSDESLDPVKLATSAS
ncbi:MAG: pyridine nucleotide-disulfide oxidoreductase [Pseudomonadales bacterium]|nr:pyridine nucleotide-disulfide oxidoreductase [Pseudomonadales bacterium]